jgi:UDPglucose 6-dehydrogenase
MTISVVGAGYVGLVTAAVFANFGNKVYCLEINPDKLSKLKSGESPFFEPGLEELLKRNLKNKNINFTDDYSEAIPDSKVVFICVGTPPKNNGEADLSQVLDSVHDIARNLQSYTVIVGKSTLPVGIGDDMYKLILKEKGRGATFDWVSNPEFLREGTALEDSLHPDRIVIGSESQKAIDLLLELHSPIDGVAIVTDTRSAELIKYASNALLATKVSFANSIANLCELTGADVEAVLNGVGYDKRLVRSMLYPGVGYGGSCLPKDVLSLLDQSKKAGYDFDLLRAVNEVNQEMPMRFVKKLKDELEGLRGKKIAILGLAYKANTDDMREAPSIKIINKLVSDGAEITAYDPEAMGVARELLPAIEFAEDVFEAVKGADAVGIVTDWNEFKDLDLHKVKELMKRPVIVDGRNLYDREKVRQLGFSYQGVGR